MRFFVIALTIVAAVAGCSSREDRIAFDGIYFNTKLSKVDGQRDVFTLLVKNASQSIEGAREAARYDATTYCVNNYGSSDITWVVGPDSPADDLVLVDDSLTFSGSCPS
jgi:hypothetical protein